MNNLNLKFILTFSAILMLSSIVLSSNNKIEKLESRLSALELAAEEQKVKKSRWSIFKTDDT